MTRRAPWWGRQFFLFLWPVAGLFACAPTQPAPESPVVAELQNSRPAPTPPAPPPPPAITSALRPPMPGDPASYPERAALASRVDVVVEGVRARDFFLSLVEGTRVGMVVHPDISGTVTLSLRNVTLKEAVTTACELYRLECRMEAGGFRILPRRLNTRTFAVDFLPIRRSGRTQTTVSSGQISESTSVSGDNNASTSRNISGSDMVTDYDANFWQDLESSLRGIIGLPVIQRVVMEKQSQGSRWGYARKEATRQVWSEAPLEGDDELERRGGRSVTVNPQAGIAIVRAMPDEMAKVEEFLAKLRASSRRQVLLEAKILEVELNDGYQYGIDWLAIHRGLNRLPPLVGEPMAGQTFQGSLQVPTSFVSQSSLTGLQTNQQINRTPYVGDNFSGLTPGGVAGVLSGGDGQPFSLALRAHDFVSFIDVLKQQGEVHVLSSPRVATTNNQKAVIKVGQDEIFITDIDVKMTQADALRQTAATTVLDPKMVPFFSGVALDVTPQISEEGAVTLHIHPMVTEVRDKAKSFVLNDSQQVYPLAFSQSREADSIIRVQDGDVAIIGGLMKKQQREDENRLPLLGDLPLVGGIFSRTSKSWVKSELIILLRPVVIRDDTGWQSQLEQTRQRVQEMTHPAEAVAWPLPAVAPSDKTK